ncbi:ATP-binding protein [Peribacillus psychrosaccharolyticus]|uniref:AlbA family DNA-binding domain-containing protein n=1 Tax=Peribacillus psychrosaccharolyticus TaxID=1407 RepID=UPI003D26E1AF
MLKKPFKEISLDDIKSLMDSGVTEGTLIDYKEFLELNDKTSKKEFAADVTSFANTEGGDLIIGVKEECGVISDIIGVEVDNQDEFLQKIENLLRDSVKPRIIGLQMKFIPINDKLAILHLHIPKSYNGPHIVNGKVFFGRNSAGKYPLEYIEIRSKFLQQMDIGRSIKDFHLDRIVKLKANEGYLPLMEGATILMNIVPLISFTFDTPFIQLGHPQHKNLWPLYGTGYDYHIGFEGIGGYASNTESIYSYNHINHKGISELADKGVLQQSIIAIQSVEDIIIRALNRLRKNYADYNIEGPYVLMLSLLDVQNFRIGYSADLHGVSSKLRQRDLVFPEIVMLDFDSISESIKPLIQLLCNAAGIHEIPKAFK